MVAPAVRVLTILSPNWERTVRAYMSSKAVEHAVRTLYATVEPRAAAKGCTLGEALDRLRENGYEINVDIVALEAAA